MIIFDFDLTLVDTRPVESLRTARKWGEVMSRAGELQVYDGITELLKELHEHNQKLAIVTKSPNMIPCGFVRRYDWPIKPELVLGHHQVDEPKPNPDGLLKAMAAADAAPEDTFHVGDKPEDTEASRAANVTSIGAGWSGINVNLLEASNPDHMFNTVEELRRFFMEIL